MLMRHCEECPLTEALSVGDIFSVAKAALEASSLSRSSSYQLASTIIIETLSPIAHQVEEPCHPIHVMIDIYPDDRHSGHLLSHKGDAWLMINFAGSLPDDWGYLSDTEMEGVITRIARTFADEIAQYQWRLRDWCDFDHHS